jgi:hypothetical protein
MIPHIHLTFVCNPFSDKRWGHISTLKIDSRIERTECSRPLIHDGESYQLRKNAIYSKHAGKMTKFNYM